MSRKTLCSLLLSWIAFLAAVVVIAPETAAAAGSSDERPNILIVVTDDQPETDAVRAVLPVLQKFPVRYTNAYATTPLCCPSRSSIFSGKYAHNHGVTVNDGTPFNADDTMQATLKGVGYNTGLVGKYLNRVTTAPYFDRSVVLEPEKRYTNTTFYINGRRRRVNEYVTTFMRRKSLDVMEDFAAKDEPWMLYVAPYAPHLPAVPERRYAHTTVPRFQLPGEGDLNDKPSYVRRLSIRRRQANRIAKDQLRSLMSINDLVEQLLGALERLKERNTVVIFTSDNGYLWYEHRLISKRYPYLPSVKVPLYLRWAGHLETSVDDDLVANVDIAPTIYSLTGIAPSYELDGRSLFTSQRDRLLLEYWDDNNGVPDWSAILRHDAMYVRYVDGQEEYYDLVADPTQSTNLLAEPDRIDPDLETLRLTLQADRSCRGSSCP